MARQSDVAGLCLILDDDLVRGRAREVLERASEAGVRLFQYRNKRGSRREVFETAHHLVQAARSRRAVLIINDHADIAAAVDADGVHLGQDDLPAKAARKLLGGTKLIGISTHSPEQAQTAAADGADYIGFGPVFATGTKDAGPVQGVDELRRIRDLVAIPILAIGGITRETAAFAAAAGADGIAVISAILKAEDLSSAAAGIIAAFTQGNVKPEQRQ